MFTLLLSAVYTRICGEFAKLMVILNVDKMKIIELKQNDKFNFLGFTFRRTKTVNKWEIIRILTENFELQHSPY